MASMDLTLGKAEVFVCLDLETTGVDVDNDRMVCASLIREPATLEFISVDSILVNPGIPIPPEATAIHGITDALVQEEGENPAEVVELISELIAGNWDQGNPLVGCNIAFDLSVFNAESQRHLGRPFDIRGPVLDIMVLHRMLSGERKASLDVMCHYYGVTNTQAHSALSDAEATLEILLKMIRRSSALNDKTFRELYTLQKKYHRSWAQGLQNWFNQKGIDKTVDGEWPIKTNVKDVKQ
jgi:DNA polymerase-3 subunit epsilon